MDRTEPFYIEVITGSYIRLTDASFTMDLLEYSYDKVNWHSFDIYQYGGYVVNVNPGDKVYMRAKPSVGTYYVSWNNRRYFTNTEAVRMFNVGGNIMSLLYGNQFTGSEVDFPSGTQNNFYGLFQWFPVADASKLLLPASTLTSNCYARMFESGWADNRDRLVKAPTITQATIQGGCPYDNMFRNCNSLESIAIENTNIRSSDYILRGMSPKTIVYKKEGVTTPSNPNNLTVVTLKNTPFNVVNAKKWVINNKEVKRVADSQGSIIWKKKHSPTVLPYFYVEDMSGSENTLSINKISDYAPTLTIEMSRDGVNWSTLGVTSKTTISTHIPAYGRVYLRCNTSSWCANLGEANCIYCSQSYRVGGNIMSLLYGGNFTGNERIFPSGSNSNFSYLFFNSSNISDSSTLILPATTMTEFCYAGMFYGCTSLTTVPELPATTLAERCYVNMFYGCTSLTTAPTLPATTLVQSCYSNMFQGCTSLTTAPTLPATTLVQSCYYMMFYDCTMLNNITCLATDMSATYCTYNWVRNVSQTGTFTKKAGVIWQTYSDGIPSGWTVVEV